MTASFKNALLIDDSEIDILVNRRLIELTNFASSVSVTGSAEEALHYLREECSADSAPDWIFLDMHLPGMDGYEFIEEFKQLPSFITKKSKIIILSVYQKQERLQRALEYDFVECQFEKPLTQEALRMLAQKKSVLTNGI